MSFFARSTFIFLSSIFLSSSVPGPLETLNKRYVSLASPSRSALYSCRSLAQGNALAMHPSAGVHALSPHES